MDREQFSQTYDFRGRTVAIPGGAGMLGSEMACALVALGANVAILHHEPSRAESLKERLERGPGRATILYADVLKRDTLISAEQAIREQFGAVTALINAAGGNSPEATTNDGLGFFDLPEESLHAVLDLNMLGTLFCCQVFGRGMAERGEGAILNISSTTAQTPLTRIPGYSAAKAGVSNFTRWLAVHMAQEYSPNIRVNALAPGFFLTKQNRYLLMDEATGELTARGRRIIDHTPLGRFGDPEDLLGATLWLLSDAARFVTGIVVPVDGGFSAFSGV